MISLRSSLLSAVAALTVFAVTYQPALAVTGSTYTVQGNVYRVVEFAGADSNEIRLKTVLKGTAANEPYAARVVAIRQSRFASWFKPNLGTLVKTNLWWMGFVAVIESAGWAIDELKGQVVQPVAGWERGYYWAADGRFDSPNNVGATKFDACAKYGKYMSAYSASYKGDLTIENGTCVWRVNGVAKAYQTPERGSCGVYNYPHALALSSCSGAAAPSVPVSDADLQSAINAQLASDPAHAATAFTDPATGKGYADLFDPVPYIPGLSAADEALVNCYIAGQLQMVDSQAACYVATQAEYDRVKQQTEALASGRTPEGEADALNETMKQPITQTQYEESNKKFGDAVADVTASVSAQNESDYSDIDENFNKLDGIITDLPHTSLPAPADISVPQYVDCQQLTLSDGNGHELVFPSPAQCAKIETFKQGFGYFLAVSVVFLLGMQVTN